MAQPHKGARVVVMTRLSQPVWDATKADADTHGISISQYVADVMAAYHGRGGHDAGTGVQEVLQLVS